MFETGKLIGLRYIQQVELSVVAVIIDRRVDKEKSTAGRAGILPAAGQLVAKHMGAASSAPTVDLNFSCYTTVDKREGL